MAATVANLIPKARLRLPGLAPAACTAPEACCGECARAEGWASAPERWRGRGTSTVHVGSPRVRRGAGAEDVVPEAPAGRPNLDVERDPIEELVTTKAAQLGLVVLQSHSRWRRRWGTRGPKRGQGSRQWGGGRACARCSAHRAVVAALRRDADQARSRSVASAAEAPSVRSRRVAST